ncbi:transketolase [Desulfovibrio intestinalis]|uniref:Transketolase n=1 Tax=Desulfovibrio intestinalis TaxID=58621 RepID=A0A7W8C0M2_9BACT|nr:transketolase [Desulfovibrio intestinalis]MBB5143101.1 transketolase [Desulfovibrio intestinalis]
MPTRRQCANAIRALAMDAVEKARSGHPGAPLGMADMAEALWRHGFRHNPANPLWFNRDRFILSNGHASMLLYALLHLTGYDLPMEEIRNFRQWGAKTAGHPEYEPHMGIEMTTGPLGQGISSAVGLALAESMLAAQFNTPEYKVVDHHTYVFVGDGCLMEGVSHEACSLAGTWGLGKLIVMYDSNGISIDGKIDAWFDEDVAARYRAYSWQVIGPVDGHDASALDKALAEAKADPSRPSLIICQTHIGFGSPKADSASSHGSPLGEDGVAATRDALGWHEAPFTVPQDIYTAWNAHDAGKASEAAWSKLFDAYAKAHPELAAELTRRMQGKLPANWAEIATGALQEAVSKGESTATRVASKKTLEYLVPRLPELAGGSADLTGSVGTLTSSSVHMDVKEHTGNYISYGVREFGMSAIMNGLALHGGFIPYAGTFLAFADQAKNALRLAAIMGIRVVWVLTHDSIGVGEDGPTHQPVEQLGMLRLMPNFHLWRPCDTVETAVAWISALEDAHTPSGLSLSRQNLPFCQRNQEQVAAIARGGYVLRDCEGTPEIIIMATGSEVGLALETADQLTADGRKARVVSMPCAEVFDAQSAEYKESVLPRAVRARLAIEAAAADWWSKYVGLDGAVIGMEGFGASAPGKVVFERLGFTVANALEKAHALMGKN